MLRLGFIDAGTETNERESCNEGYEELTGEKVYEELKEEKVYEGTSEGTYEGTSE